jgi:hypothetical protein
MSPLGSHDLPGELDAEFHRVAVIAASGDLVAARTALRRLADRALAAGRHAAASQALRLSAALDRVLGDSADAVATARRAVELAGTDHALAAAALDELGEAQLNLGHALAAAEAFDRAAFRAAATGQPTAPALRRKQAYALAAGGRSEDSAAVLRDLVGATGDPGERAAMLVQAAAGAAGTAGAQGLWDAARKALDEVEPAPAAGGTATGRADGTGGSGGAGRALRADLAFVAAARALDAGDLAGALVRVREARRHALDAVAPLAYIAAAIAESALAELAGDDVAAYGSLATGYATLGDLVGKPLSASTFESPLLALRQHWGPERFTAAKAAYEARRRAAATPIQDPPGYFTSKP